MKRGIISFAAIVVAILAFAFTSPKSSTENSKALTNYYWFDFSNNTLIPLLATDPTSTTDPYGCPAAGSNICTRAYLPNDTELFMDGSVQKRRPKISVTIQIEIKKVIP